MEVEHIEKVQQQLASNASTLHIDISIFETRVERINSELDTLARTYNDTISLELGREFDKYKALRKIYEKQVKTYHFCVKEQMELETQLANLKTDVINGNMGKQEFKNHLRTEREDVTSLLDKSQDLSKRLYEVEPEFMRLSALVAEILKTLD